MRYGFFNSLLEGRRRGRSVTFGASQSLAGFPALPAQHSPRYERACSAHRARID